MTTPYASIGYTRDDGDFRILATLNNIDSEFDDDLFNDAIGAVRDLLQTRLNEASDGVELEILERQDAPDFVILQD